MSGPGGFEPGLFEPDPDEVLPSPATGFPANSAPGSAASSHRQMLKSSAIIGGASVINIAVGLFRTKIAALILGPAGVGLIGLLQNLVQTASNLAAFGLGTAGTRAIAAAGSDGAARARVRRALLGGSLVLALLGGAATWLLRVPLARWALGDTAQASVIGWLALGTVFSVLGGAQVALLVGLRRIGDAAGITIGSALTGSLAGVGAVVLAGYDGIAVFVLAPLAAAWLVGAWFVWRLPPAELAPAPSPAAVRAEFRSLLGAGAAFLVAGVGTTLAQLVARALIQHRLGAAAVGQFQASWMISIVYVGFVLQAMGADYYPRLTEAIGRSADAHRLIDEQSEVALLLSAPVLLGTLGAAPWIIPLLYADAFAPAAEILRWQILADLFKIASWPLGYVLLARGAARTYMAGELAASAVLIGALWVLLPLAGLPATGIAVLIAYALYLPVLAVIVRRSTGYRWSRQVAGLFAAVFAAALAVMALARFSSLAALTVGALFAVIAAAHALVRLDEALPGFLRRPVGAWRALTARRGARTRR